MSPFPITGIETDSLSNFINTLNISCYSFTEISKLASSMMNNGGSLLTVSYYGANKVMPNYNVMGPSKASLEANVRFLAADLGPDTIRVNAISAGPIKTLAASGVSGFRGLLKHVESITPLRRNVTIQDVGNTAAFLSSDLSAGITGETIYVDAGYRNLGMTFETN